MGFGALRLLDEQWLVAGATIDSERRANMEILIWMIDGHVDLLIGEVTHALEPGGFACISAGSGVDCALRNPRDVPALFVELWLQPSVVNAAPRCSVHGFADAQLRGNFRNIESSADADAEIELRANAKVWVALGDAGERLRHPLAATEKAWLQVLRGSVDCGDITACAGDGIEVFDQEIIDLRVRDEGEFLLIELA